MSLTLGELKKILETAPDDTDISQYFPVQEIEKRIVPEMVTDIPIEGAVAQVKHSCNPGDIMASLVACKKYYEITGRKVKYMQKINYVAGYYPGAVHPTVDETGTNVTLNRRMFNLIKPLVESQEYIDSFEEYDGQRVDINFDGIRGETFVNLPHGSIQAWLFYAFPELEADISKPWVFLKSTKQQIEEVTKGKILVNFTERYRNTQIPLEYHFLRKYSPDLIFAGTETEHFKFCTKWGIDMPLLKTNDFLEDAYAIRGARFLLCNQSWMWNCATALGTPRLLEVCNFAQNCMPFYGDDNRGYFHQVALEHYFRMMYNNTMYK